MIPTARQCSAGFSNFTQNLKKLRGKENFLYIMSEEGCIAEITANFIADNGTDNLP